MKVIGNLTKDAIIRAAVSEGINVTQEIGTGVVFESAATQQQTVVYDSTNQKIVIGYRDQGNSNYGTAVVATVSGNSISYGTPTVFYSATTGELSGAFDSNSGKVVFSFEGGKSVVGTVSGTGISFGSVATFNSSGTDYTSTTFDSTNNKIVIFYRDTGNSNSGTAIVGTVSGTDITFGSEVVVNSGNTPFPACSFDSNAGKVVAAYKDSGNSNYGTAIIGTVSGTSISFGSEAVFNTGNTTDISIAFDSTNNKVVIAYTDSGNSSYGTAIVGTVSGTSISFGSEVVYNSGSTSYNSASFDSSAGRVLISYSDAGNSDKGEAVVGTVSGTSISFGDMALFKNGSTDFISSAYDSNQGRVVIAYRTPGNSNYGEAVVFRVGYSQATGGTIADGKAVVVNANGTVSTVSESAASVGTTVTFASATSPMYKDASVFDSNSNKVVVAYYDGGNSDQGTAIVGTIDNSDNSISFGSEVVFETGSTRHMASTFDTSNNKVVIAYRDNGNSNYGTAVVGTVSGTSISFGTPVVYNSGDLEGVGITFDSNNNKVVISYADKGGSPTRGKAIVGTVSGTSISFGSEVTFENNDCDYTAATFDTSNNKVVISFSDKANNNYGTAVVGTVSGTSISFGSAVVFASEYTIFNPIVFDSSNNKVVIAYREGVADHGKAVVGTVSGTSISFGSAVTFNSAAMSEVSATFDTSSNKVVIVYKDTGNSSKGTAIAGTVSGTSISFGSELVYQTGAVADNTVVYDSNANRLAVFYRDDASPMHGKANVFNFPSTNLTSENFVGFMKGAALDGTNGEILSSCSIARNQTSLTPGQTYFVSPTDGALSTSAGSPSVTAGTAISNTELIVKG